MSEQDVKQLPLRSEITDEYKWAVDRVYADTEAWEKDYAAAKALLPELASFRGRLGEGWQVMLEYLQLDEKFSLLLERLYLYAHMRRDEDNGKTGPGVWPWRRVRSRPSSPRRCWLCPKSSWPPIWSGRSLRSTA